MKKNSLFSPIQLRSITIPNRITISPMCQYSAVEGNANEWHMSHYMQMATSGAGMFVIESTAVSKQGRISYGDLGLYSSSNEDHLARVIKSCKKYSETPIACQLSHSGRKGSVNLPWLGGKHLTSDEGGWDTVSASAISRYDGGTIPSELDLNQLNGIRQDFIKATQRAIKANVDIVELHIAHGYLLHQFFSPIANRRVDEYGGNFANRIKFILEVVSDVRRTWPADKPIGIRVTAQDWLDGGSTIDDCIDLVLQLKEIGIDYICVSSGGIIPITNLVPGIGFQVKFASEIKRRTGMVTRVTGEINDYKTAQKIIESNDADLIAIGRSYLNDPRWAWRAAIRLKEEVLVPEQYQRGYW
ncbi:MAG: NADH:flavin oxidoreductase/NADH oxidase [Lentimicrobiaceae bacterium]|jgi:2,4-dienoyl-CoA reductase-like NADH-dependent reductase (Old Yellow Enzyme family)|nr:NADH:flavin oxidoreductase/NADH oxidase [Lentimicrobiaceae bacterium]